jgi:AcrR family transcriptional regulator
MPDADRIDASERESADDPLLSVVAEILDTEGYDAVQLREVARRSRISLRTIYKRYGSRDELIIAALETWMAQNRFAGLADLAIRADDSVYDSMVGYHRAIFEPWERHPLMLMAYHRASTGPGGERLFRPGREAAQPLMQAIATRTDATVAQDIGEIMANIIYALTGRFADGEIEIAEVLRGFERAAFYLTGGLVTSPGPASPAPAPALPAPTSKRAIQR